MRQENIIVIPTQAAATITGTAIPAAQLFQCSVQINTTGSAGGTVKLQASNDAQNDQYSSRQTPTNWSDIPSAAATVSAAGSVLIPKTDLCYQYIRVVYTNTGTGTIQVTLKALGD